VDESRTDPPARELELTGTAGRRHGMRPTQDVSGAVEGRSLLSNHIPIIACACSRANALRVTRVSERPGC